MSEAFNAAFEHVAHRLAPGSRLLSVQPLIGGNSAQVSVVELEWPDGTRQKVIVRRYGGTYRTHKPGVAAEEFRLLQLLHAEGRAVPWPYFVDLSREIFAEPYLVLKYVEGETKLAPDQGLAMAGPMAAELARFHQIDGARADTAFLTDHLAALSQNLAEPPANLDDTLDEGLIRAALAGAWPGSEGQPGVVVHGDYWPGNVIWLNGQLAAVIDWEDAGRGDPLADVGNARLELFWGFGREAMEAFTRHYESLTGVDLATLPYWDLAAALRPAGKISAWGLPAEQERAMRASHREFVEEALGAL